MRHVSFFFLMFAEYIQSIRFDEEATTEHKANVVCVGRYCTEICAKYASQHDGQRAAGQKISAELARFCTTFGKKVSKFSCFG